jgi:E3 ubiquitin-protein ligase UBR4
MPPGTCRYCRENARQCKKCRNINYENLDAFICNECGYCKYARFEYTFTAVPAVVVAAVESEVLGTLLCLQFGDSYVSGILYK